MDLPNLAKEYLASVKPMQLATQNGDNLWICTVYFVADDNFNLYWASARSRKHSTDLLNNPSSSVAVLKDGVKKQALQITGKSYEVNDTELSTVHSLYQSKYGPNDFDLEEMKKRAADGRSYWVFRPTKMFLWDEVNFPNDPKQEIAIPDAD
jgi:uncharacterized protein YhbP (UPF0306 family)